MPFCEHRFWTHRGGGAEPEWINVVTSLVFTVLGFSWASSTALPKTPRDIWVVALVILGLGSAGFHMNFQWPMLHALCKALDETSMCVVVLMMPFAWHVPRVWRRLTVVWFILTQALAYSQRGEPEDYFPVAFGVGAVVNAYVLWRHGPTSPLVGAVLRTAAAAACVWVAVETTCTPFVATYFFWAHGVWHLAMARAIHMLLHVVSTWNDKIL